VRSGSSPHGTGTPPAPRLTGMRTVLADEGHAAAAAASAAVISSLFMVFPLARGAIRPRERDCQLRSTSCRAASRCSSRAMRRAGVLLNFRRTSKEVLRMLATKDGVATVAVRNLNAAKKFYEGTLGLKRADSPEPEPPVYQAGKFRLLVYQSRYAGTNQATAVTWDVGEDIENVVQELKAKGVTFEHYDGLPQTTRLGDVHVTGRLKAAWFKDPDDNIHALVGR